MSTEPDKVLRTVVIEVPPGFNTPMRLDVYLTQKLANATRNKVQEGIKAGMVLVNQKTPKASQVVQPLDVITCQILKPPPIEAVPEAIPLDIRYEDEHLLVLEKPAGMVVHPAYGNRTGTLVNALLHHLGLGTLRFDAEAGEETDEQEEESLSPVFSQLAMRHAGPRYAGDATIRPGLVHRLDKDTSGLMVIAKSDAVHAALANQFASRTIERRYRAIVWGVPAHAEGRIETQLGRDKRDRKLVSVLPSGQGKHAITNYQMVEALSHFALVEFKLETGRTHQIRVHAKYIGHPIFGDPTYEGQQIRFGLGIGSKKAFFENLFKRLPRQALHAWTLGFVHPVTGAPLFFTSEWPADMQHVWSQLKKMAFQTED